MQTLLARDDHAPQATQTLWLHPARRDMRRKLT
jgi:hypothetical protein